MILMQSGSVGIDSPGVWGNEDVTVTFPGPVRSAVAMLSGFVVSYGPAGRVPTEDNHVSQVAASATVSSLGGISGRSVTVNCVLNLFDEGRDDHISGSIDFVVIADVLELPPVVGGDLTETTTIATE